MTERVVKVTLTLSASQYQAELEKAKKATEGLGKSSEESSKKATGAMDQMVKSARDNGEAWSAAGGALLTFGGVVTGIGIAALKTGIQYNTLQQTTRAALTSLLGSAEAANAQMDKLDAFARTSPFSKSTFITAQQQMLAFGIEAQKVVPYLDAVQNAVAAAGGSNADIEGIVATMSKIQSSAKITAEDLNELGGRGVNAAELIGSQMGMTGAQVRDAITKGSLDAGVALDALAAGMTERFDGAADGVKNTFVGAMDRVKAAWRDFSASLAEPLVGQEGGGLFVSLLNGTADLMRNFMALPEPVRNVTAVIGGLVGGISLLAGTLVTAYPKWLEWKANFDKFVTSAGPAGKAMGLLRTAALPIAGILAAGAIAFQIWGDKAKAAQSRATGFADTVGDMGASVTKAVQNLTTGTDSDWGFAEKWNTRVELFSMGAQSFNEVAAMLGQNADDIARAMSMSESEFEEYRKAIILTSEEMGYGTGVGSEYATKIGEQRTAIASAAEAQRVFKEVTGDTAVVTEEQAAATAEAAKAYEKWRDTIAGGMSAFTDVAGAYQSVIDKNREVAETTAEATKSSKDDWQDYYDGVSVSTGDWIAELQKQADAMQNWRSNILTVTAQVRERMPADMVAAADAMLDEWIAKGPAMADEIQNFMTASPEQQAEIVSIWRLTAAGATAEFGNELAAARGMEIPTELTVDTAPADLEMVNWYATTSGEVTTTQVAAKTDAAMKAVSDFFGVTASTTTATKVDANTGLAQSSVKTTTDWIALQNPSVTMGANDWSARSTVNATLGWTAQQSASISVKADTSTIGGAIASAVANARASVGSISIPARASFAGGGGVHGAGTGTSDSIPAMLSNGEHVWTAAEVAAAGGQGEMYRMRQAVKAGRVARFANGGEVGGYGQYMSMASSPVVNVSGGVSVDSLRAALQGLAFQTDGEYVRLVARRESVSAVGSALSYESTGLSRGGRY